MSRIRDKELVEYQKQIGKEIYSREYHRLYHWTKQHKGRHSNLEYENSKEKLQHIKEKYKNGVTPEILVEFGKNI